MLPEQILGDVSRSRRHPHQNWERLSFTTLKHRRIVKRIDLFTREREEWFMGRIPVGIMFARGEEVWHWQKSNIKLTINCILDSGSFSAHNQKTEYISRKEKCVDAHFIVVIRWRKDFKYLKCSNSEERNYFIQWALPTYLVKSKFFNWSKIKAMAFGGELRFWEKCILSYLENILLANTLLTEHIFRTSWTFFLSAYRYNRL